MNTSKEKRNFKGTIIIAQNLDNFSAFQEICKAFKCFMRVA